MASATSYHLKLPSMDMVCPTFPSSGERRRSSNASQLKSQHLLDAMAAQQISLEALLALPADFDVLSAISFQSQQRQRADSTSSPTSSSFGASSSSASGSTSPPVRQVPPASRVDGAFAIELAVPSSASRQRSQQPRRKHRRVERPVSANSSTSSSSGSPTLASFPQPLAAPAADMGHFVCLSQIEPVPALAENICVPSSRSSSFSSIEEDVIMQFPIVPSSGQGHYQPLFS